MGAPRHGHQVVQSTLGSLGGTGRVYRGSGCFPAGVELAGVMFGVCGIIADAVSRGFVPVIWG